MYFSSFPYLQNKTNKQRGGGRVIINSKTKAEKWKLKKKNVTMIDYKSL